MCDQFIYVTYIRTSAEKLWHALIAPEFTRQYWCETWQDCTWEIGKPWKLMTPDGRAADSGEVVEFDPPRRLMVTWQNHLFAACEAEGFTKASYDLEPVGDVVKLTVTHQFQKPDSAMYKAVSGGWPGILASLKSLLETGEPLEIARYWPKGV